MMRKDAFKTLHEAAEYLHFKQKEATTYLHCLQKWMEKLLMVNIQEFLLDRPLLALFRFTEMKMEINVAMTRTCQHQIHFHKNR